MIRGPEPRQTWMIRGDVRLLSVHHTPALAPPHGAVVLLAGFSHPMCDVDYFMSRLARRLATSGFMVAQVDPRGHGDSPGELSDVDLETLRRDLSCIADHYSGLFGGDPLFVGRGLAAALLAELSTQRRLRGVAGVAPYAIAPKAVREHLDATGARSGDAFFAFPGNDYVAHTDFSSAARRVLRALGAIPYNLHGAAISARLLEHLAEFDALQALRQADAARCLWLWPDAGTQAGFRAVDFTLEGAAPPDGAGPEDPFLRNPVAQQAVIARLADWALALRPRSRCESRCR